MSGFKLTPSAETDLFEIWTYIARDNPEAADRVETAILDAVSALTRSYSSISRTTFPATSVSR